MTVGLVVRLRGLCAALAVACFWAGAAAAAGVPVPDAAVHVDTAELLSQTSPRYNCWNIDGSRNRGFQWRNLSSPSLLQLAAGLPAGYVRFGGSGNDALWYGDGIGQDSCAAASPRHFNCLNSSMVDGLLALAAAANARLVFGLNLDNTGLGLHWNGSPSWNSTNAEGIVRYLAARGQPYAFELGNEDNGHFPAQGLSPEQEAQGFAKLAAILAEVYPDQRSRPKIIGPDADYQDRKPAQARIYREWAKDFLGNVSKYKVPLTAATLHEYIEVGWNGSAWTSLDPEVLDRTASCADDWRGMVQSTARRVGLAQPEVWAGEIGPHNGGSPPCNHSSMRWANFANSFWYMDAMATKAAHGFDVFCRQDFIGADYGLLDCSTQTPLPDYVLSKQWTRLMGAAVLNASVLHGPRTVRAYAHCAADSAHDIVLLLLNLASQPVVVELGGTSPAGASVATTSSAAAAGGATTAAPPTRDEEWHFTAGSGGLGGSTIRLGGHDLVWGGDGHPLPPMPGVLQPEQPGAGRTVKLAPQSIVFVRLAGAAPDGLCSSTTDDDAPQQLKTDDDEDDDGDDARSLSTATATATAIGFAATPAARGILAPLHSRQHGGRATVDDVLAPLDTAGHSNGGSPPSSYPCYQATCAGNASCCHYGGADMCCWNGSPKVPGPVSWHCGGVAFGMHPKGLCCPPNSPFGCPGFGDGTACCPAHAPICCQRGGCCPLGTACNGVVNGTAHCLKLPS